MSAVAVIGGGAAGMMAAISAAECGHQVTVYEKNEKLGKKLFITGKGRCNITNACSVEELLQNVVTNEKFLYSSFYSFTSDDMISLMERCGCPVKVERGNRVFPVSDKSSDVIRALSDYMKQLGVKVFLNTPVEALWMESQQLQGILLKNKKKISADAVVVATGGLSYESTGSTGDGYRYAKSLGHTITDLSPALVAIETIDEVVKELQGLSLKNIQITIKNGKRTLFDAFGEMMFTHFGVSGPVILSASSFVARQLKKNHLDLLIDLKPALTSEQLDLRILREFKEFQNKQFKNALIHLYPAKLIPVMIEKSGISPDKKVNEITKVERERLIELTKGFPLTLSGMRSFKEAVITQGGVAVKEINPSTMESKKCPGLYFVGEVLDLDAVTGGFNLQIAWSTAWLAGRSIGLE